MFGAALARAPQSRREMLQRNFKADQYLTRNSCDSTDLSLVVKPGRKQLTSTIGNVDNLDLIPELLAFNKIGGQILTGELLIYLRRDEIKQ